MSETYFKATRLDGTSFHDGKTRWEVGKVTRLPDGSKLPYLSVSVVATDCTGMAWPCRLFRVEPVEGHEVTTPSAFVLPNKRGSTAWRVVEELDARQVFGPNADEVLAILERARTLTNDEVRRMASKRYGAWRDAWDAASCAARDAAREAAWRVVQDAAWNVARRARDVARYAAVATLVRDLITQEQYEKLMACWWAVVGR